MVPDSKPLVSVLMTAYNRERYIAEAIESVLLSTYTHFELIIVDDCSRDNTVKIAQEYLAKDRRIQVYVNERNMGDYPNRNQAASYAKGKYLKYVDSDDAIYPETLAIMVGAMEQHPDAALAISSRSESSQTYFLPAEVYQTHFFVRGILDHGPTAVMIRAKVFNAIGKFKEIRNVSDFDLWLRIAAQFPVVELQRNLIFWRQHPDQEINLDPFKYLEYQLPILIENLSSDNCPLSMKDRDQIIQKNRAILARKLVKNILRFQKVSKSIRIWYGQDLSLKNLLYAR